MIRQWEPIQDRNYRLSIRQRMFFKVGIDCLVFEKAIASKHLPDRSKEHDAVTFHQLRIRIIDNGLDGIGWQLGQNAMVGNTIMQ